MANENVNVDQAVEIGEKVLKLMENQAVAEFSFKSSWNPLTWHQNSKISSKHEEVFIDPNLLFQRFTTIVKNINVSLEHLIKLELSSLPAASAKFPTKNAPKLDKAKFAENLKKFSNTPDIIVNIKT